MLSQFLVLYSVDSNMVIRLFVRLFLLSFRSWSPMSNFVFRDEAELLDNYQHSTRPNLT